MFKINMKNIPIFFILFLLTFPALALGAGQPSENFKTTAEILEMVHDESNTNCASEIFSNALYENADAVSESDSEDVVRTWARQTMESPEVLEQVLNCPEISDKNIPETKTINFTPIVYKFSAGKNARTITINYSSSKKILKQKILLAKKPSLPNGDPNPKLMDPNDPAKYLNTEPSWYAIMVVQHDALSEFVGPDKNNTVSMKYINDHIDSIYPRGHNCTSKSAITLGNNNDTINRVVHEVVGLSDDSNDYYVAGDVNLEWVMYAEIAADVLLTLATAGVGEAAMFQLKSLRAVKNGKELVKSMRNLLKVKDVKKYVETTKTISAHTDDIAKLEKEIKTLKNSDKIADKRKEIKKLQESIKKAEGEADNLLKNSDDVKNFKKQADTLQDVHKYFKQMHQFRRSQTGNLGAIKKLNALRKSIKAANDGAKTLNKANRVVRAGMSSRSARIGDWLKDATLKHGARLAKFERNLGNIYAFVAFLGDMWDKTSSTSKDFSNGIEFKPLCLLSADDIKGQENVVNYGMWLMWTGNMDNPADDDAAYLQVMDFAAKFFYQLDEYQDEHGANCNVDIYIVHPIIRLDETNETDPHGELFYLFMNEIPWTTAPQFEDQ